MRLPDCRAFLVRLSEQTDPALQHPVGRIEHVETGLRGSFSSFEELRDFVASVLAEEALGEDEGPGSAANY